VYHIGLACRRSIPSWARPEQTQSLAIADGLPRPAKVPRSIHFKAGQHALNLKISGQPLANPSYEG
jgi:hypothetical protein